MKILKISKKKFFFEIFLRSYSNKRAFFRDPKYAKIFDFRPLQLELWLETCVKNGFWTINMPKHVQAPARLDMFGHVVACFSTPQHAFYECRNRRGVREVSPLPPKNSSCTSVGAVSAPMTSIFEGCGAEFFDFSKHSFVLCVCYQLCIFFVFTEISMLWKFIWYGITFFSFFA